MSPDLPASDRPAPGTELEFRWRKFDASGHWEHDVAYLGSDEWGDWVGQQAGWRSERPGKAMPAGGPNVTLVPPEGTWVATFNTAHPTYRVYIDVAWDVGWRGGELTGIDMDLDVVEYVAGGVAIEDRDEWDEHRVRYGYPLELVAQLEQVAVDLEQRLRAGSGPFDAATAAGWLARLDELGGRRVDG